MQYEIISAVNDSRIAVPLEQKPDQVWTVLDLPKLIVELESGGKPRHWYTAFMEDRMHDWDWCSGKFRFYGHSGSRGDMHKLLLIYKD